jgi:outer membrane protein TolC
MIDSFKLIIQHHRNRRTKFLTALIIGICFLSARLRGQDRPDTLVVNSLSEVIDKALKNNPTITVYRQQVLQARYNLNTAKGFIYPTVSGSFNGQDNLHLAVTPVPGELIGKPGTTFYAQFGKTYVYNSGLNFQENVLNWTSFLQAKVAEGNYQLSKAQQDSYNQNLREQVARLYFTALIAKKSLQIAQLDKNIADTMVTLAKQKLDQGASDIITYNQALINYNSVLQNIALDQQLYDQSVENLKITLGEKPATELNFKQQLNTDTIPQFGSLNLAADKNLQNYQQQLFVAALQARSQRSVSLPSLSFNGYYGAQQFRNDFGLSFDNRAWSPYRYIGLNISVPVFTGLYNYNKYRSAVTQRDIAKTQYEAAVTQSAINDRLLLKSNADYTANVRASGDNFRLYFKNLTVNQQKFTEGVISLDVYLKSFDDYLKSENIHLNNLSTLLSNQATILSRQ